MPSFDAVNYSLRPSKTIQRALAFDGIRKLRDALRLDDQVYVGFGSVWFTDFVAAHKSLGIDDMISIEADDIGYARAEFNKPYASVIVRHGLSNDILPKIRVDDRFKDRPWVVWLDYDSQFTEAVADDLRWSVENAPENSILMTTFNGRDDRYGGQPDHRIDHLRTLFGGVVPDELSKKSVRQERMAQTLANLTSDFLTSVAAQSSRPGGFRRAFRMLYTDTAPMVTVGGVLPSPARLDALNRLTTSEEWKCVLAAPIEAPHLTLKEAASLQSLLPRLDALTRDVVKGLGFDLEVEQIQAFQAYYRQYPSFAQVLV